MKFRTVINTLVGLLPATSFKNFLLRRGGWHVGPRVSVHSSLFVGMEHVQLSLDSSIGSFNVFRNVQRLSLAEGASIGQFNWVTGGASGLPNGKSSLDLGAHSAITSRHYLDVSGGLTIGRFATLAGERTVVLTHQIDYRTAKQSHDAVILGEYSLISSGVNIVPGAVVPRYSVVAMGSVIIPGLVEERALYAGVPAVLKRQGIDGEYFSRLQGPVELDLGE